MGALIVIWTIGAAVAASTLAPGEPAHADRAEWVADPTEAGCGVSLARLPPPSGVKALSYIPSIMGPGAQLLVSPAPPGQSAPGTVLVTLTPSRESFTFVVGLWADEIGTNVYLNTGDPTFNAAFARSEGIRIAWSQAPALQIAYRGSRAAGVALAECRTTRLRGYGIDPTMLVELTAEQKVAAAVGPNDYPAAAMRAGRQGRAITVLDFAGDGTVSGCRIVKSAGDPDLDGTTCRVAYRLRIDPVKNRAVRQTLYSIVWGLPTG